MAIAAFHVNQRLALSSPMNGNSGLGALSVAPTGNGSAAGLDQSSISREADGPEGNINPAVLQMMYETKLQSDLQSLESAKQSGEEDKVNQATQALGSTYGDAQQKSVPLSKDLESQVRQALGLSEGEGGDQGNLDALNQGGFNADDGSSGGGGGGGGGGGCGGGGCGGGGCIGGGGFGGGGDAVSPKNLTEDDKRFLNDAISQDSQTFGDLVKSWRQGPDGNCATVAAIKAAMDRYDNQVFDSVDRSENGYNIMMQDGYKMSLSDGELAAAKQAAKFQGPDGPGKSYATFLYGAAAKRNSLDNGMSLGQAFNDLNDGESIYSPAKLLGLYNQMVPVDPRTLNGQDSVVAGSFRHAVFVNKNANGSHTTDLWGSAKPFNGTDGLGNGLINAYTFKPRNYGNGGGSGPRASASTSTSTSTRTSTPRTSAPVRSTPSRPSAPTPAASTTKR